MAALVVLAGCSEVNLLSYGAKTFAGDDAAKPAPVATNNTGVDRGTAKIGKPYQIDGIWYYPAEDLTYDETGIASWYGEPFHGRKTANGAVYDMNKMTAAHKTLPLPTDVRVTNLENGRSIVVTVNDRGPFAHSRIIDLSKRSAELLGIIQKGTAKVRVQVLDSDGNTTATANSQVVAKPVTPLNEKNNVTAAPRATITTDALAPPSNVKTATGPSVEPLPAPVAERPVQVVAVSTPATSTTIVSVEPVRNSEIFIQAGAFVDFSNANKLSARLSTMGPSKVSQVLVNGQDFYRVRVGPVYDIEQADQLLANLINAGHTGARIIIE
ncbi:septal ring lytic transglycosylase RlpA family protein [Sneathiella marina]|uniref:septal ring lytic transglycosylase RlpA family protein n=1 Tax=Sneathiella marina TaxID=2950108 RepID=UPI00237C65C0|nr:septal ring lytic transglycosylase RlpA family protein [Sneathiella marina]